MHNSYYKIIYFLSCFHLKVLRLNRTNIPTCLPIFFPPPVFALRPTICCTFSVRLICTAERLWRHCSNVYLCALSVLVRLKTHLWGTDQGWIMALTLTQISSWLVFCASSHNDNRATLLFMLTWSKICSASCKTSHLLLPSLSLVFCRYRPNVCCGGVKSGGVQLWVRWPPPGPVSVSDSAACFGWSVCQREIRKEDLSWLSLLTFIYFFPSANGRSCQSRRDHDSTR